MSFTEKYDPNPQTQNQNLLLEKKTKGYFVTHKGYTRFAQECSVTQPQTQTYNVYSLNQVTQTLLFKIYSDNFDVHKGYPVLPDKPMLFQFMTLPKNYEKILYCYSFIHKLDPIHQKILRFV